ncbi:hypothetical protein K439DRAFT_1631953 [Ramaria rubella]|nr:hypothetical protein K439DRAFT_1631953 [Ramaria rubella]
MDVRAKRDYEFITCCALQLSLTSLVAAIGVPAVLNTEDFWAIPWADGVLTAAEILWLVFAAVVDIMISIIMIIILKSAKSKTDFSDTRDIISRLSRITLQTGTLTSFLAFATLFILTQIHTGNMYNLFTNLLGKSYALSLLATLNTRSHGCHDRNFSINRVSQSRGTIDGAPSFFVTIGSVSENHRQTVVQIQMDGEIRCDEPDTTSRSQECNFCQ